MKRNVLQSFLAWEKSQERKPLVLMGARQVGKTWLMRELAEVQPKSIALNEDFTFKGRLAENYVLQQLCGRSDGMTRYWSEREEKEIDFVIQHEGEIVPVEVKSGEDRRATTFKNYVKAHSPKWAIRFSRRNLRKDGGFVNIPLYLVERFADCF